MCQRHFGPSNSNSTQAQTELPATPETLHLFNCLEIHEPVNFRMPDALFIYACSSKFVKYLDNIA